MDLTKVSEILEGIFKQALEYDGYEYGLPTTKGTSNKIASRSLYNSIEAVPTNEGIFIFMEPYGKFVNSGRQSGKYVPIGPIIDWINHRNIQPNISLEQRQLSFAIGINKKREREGKKKIPVRILIDWMNKKNIVPEQDADKDKKSMAFGISKNIQKYGIPAKPFGWLDYAVELMFNNKDLDEALGNMVVEDLLNKLEGI